jgi:formylglycine-generating enzyme required for sulfatase activity
MIKLAYILISFFLLAGSSVLMTEPPSKSEWISIPTGEFYPFFADTVKPIKIDEFFIASTQVTNAQFLKFVKANKNWQRSNIKPIFAESSYLRYWESDTILGKYAPPNAPVVSVSWFAANAYCKWIGGRLADMSEWEYVASASKKKMNAYNDNSFSSTLLRLYEKLPKIPLPNVGENFKNAYGVYDMHGLVWEWTRDFNSVIVSTDARDKTNQDGKLFCAAGSIGNVDPTNYSAFVRYSMWSSLQAKFCLRNLGFRCVKDK